VSRRPSAVAPRVCGPRSPPRGPGPPPPRLSPNTAFNIISSKCSVVYASGVSVLHAAQTHGLTTYDSKTNTSPRVISSHEAEPEASQVLAIWSTISPRCRLSSSANASNDDARGSPRYSGAWTATP
jgi:hypothetical protein